MKISVIVPVYNVESYLDKCLNSLVNQTLKDIEIIIVNDGTKDNSEKIIKKYLKKYKNIKYFKKENGGLSSARNYGISKSSGEYIGFVDSDDFIDTTMYEKLYNKIIENDYSIAVCDVYLVFDKKLTYTSSNIKKDALTKEEIKETMLNVYPTVWNKLYKKELFNDLKFKEKVWFEDVEILYRMFPYLDKIGVVKEPLYYYVQREGAITSKVTNKIYDYIDNFNGIVKYYKDSFIFNEYKNELEYSYVRYIYATFIKRVMNFDYENFVIALKEATKNVKTNFPNHKKNKLFYKSLKGIYLVLFNEKIAKLFYKIKHKSI